MRQPVETCIGRDARNGFAVFRADAPEEDFGREARDLDDFGQTRFAAGRAARGGPFQERFALGKFVEDGGRHASVGISGVVK